MEFFNNFSFKDLVYICIIVGVYLFIPKWQIDGVDGLPPIKPIVVKTDSKGTSYSQVSGTLYTPEQMKKLTDSIQHTLKQGKVIQVSNTITVVDTVYKTDKVYIDTVTGHIFAQDSNRYSYLSFDGNYRQNTGLFTLRLTPDTQTVYTTIKHRLFKPDQLNNNIYHTNSLMRPVSGNVYTSQIKKPLFVLGPFVGVGYSGKVVPVIGFGLTFNLISLHRK